MKNSAKTKAKLKSDRARDLATTNGKKNKAVPIGSTKKKTELLDITKTEAATKIRG